MKIYKNTLDEDCVAWTDENGQENSMLKSAYDEMLVKQNEANTLASNATASSKD